MFWDFHTNILYLFEFLIYLKRYGLMYVVLVWIEHLRFTSNAREVAIKMCTKYGCANHNVCLNYWLNIPNFDVIDGWPKFISALPLQMNFSTHKCVVLDERFSIRSFQIIGHFSAYTFLFMHKVNIYKMFNWISSAFSINTVPKKKSVGLQKSEIPCCFNSS